MYSIYTRPNCIWCVRAKELLTRKGISFNDLDITDDNLRSELKSKAPGIKTIPQIFKDNERIGDYKNLVEHLKEEKIIFGNNELKFKIDPFKKKCLIEGLDDIALSLEKSSHINEFEKKVKSARPWIFND